MTSNIESKLWDYSFGNNRTPEEWEQLVNYLQDSLSDFLGVPVHSSEFSFEDEEDAKHSSAGTLIKIHLAESLDLMLVGVLSLSVNHLESARAYAILLLFCGGKRMIEHPMSSSIPSEAVWLNFVPNENNVGEWTYRLTLDECSEWEMYMSIEDWPHVN